MKSEKLKKLENELKDLNQWKDLGLVPKKDLDKHNQEIGFLEKKISEEHNRLEYLRESGDSEEYTMPKRSPQAKQPFQDTPTMSDIGIGSNSTASEMTYEATSFEPDHTTLFDVEERGGGSEDKTTVDEEEEENPFSDRNRWKRGILEDPDSDNW